MKVFDGTGDYQHVDGPGPCPPQGSGQLAGGCPGGQDVVHNPD